ncbi:MAG: hypothetical protein WEB30_07465 [Cyclobacteriaceae bacterium]
MKTMKLTLPLLTVVFLQSCAIRPLTYFEIEPFIKPSRALIHEPLNLVLLEDVRDSFAVEGEGVKRMKVTEFRRSLAASMENALRDNFDVISLSETKPDSGLSLVIYRVKPFWKINSRMSSPSAIGGAVYYSTSSMISAGFRFESALFFDNKKIRDADGTVYSDDQMSVISQAHQVFKDGLTRACEAINLELFRDEQIATDRAEMEP